MQVPNLPNIRILLFLLCYYLATYAIEAQVLFGTAPLGGNGAGTITKYEVPSNNLTSVYKFPDIAKNPSNLTLASNGKLYGTTATGGNSGYGYIFSLDPVSSEFKPLRDFDSTTKYHNAVTPQVLFTNIYPYNALVQAVDGKLYGIAGNDTSQSIFYFDPATLNYTTVKHLNASQNEGFPYGALIQASNGKLYGLAYDLNTHYGLIFSFDPVSLIYNELKHFDSTYGAIPNGILLQAADGKLYGTSPDGGSKGYGTIFSYDIATNTLAKLIDFDGCNGAAPKAGLIQASDGKLYGTTRYDRGCGPGQGAGVMFSWDPLSYSYSVVLSLGPWDLGWNPTGTLVEASDGKIYGTTPGGDVETAIIFSYDPKSKIADGTFISGEKNIAPQGNLVEVNGELFGIILRVGALWWEHSSFGAIFSFKPSSEVYKEVKKFNVTGGGYPQGSLVQLKGDKLYGVTAFGGDNLTNSGVIFSYDPKYLSYKKLTDLFGQDYYSETLKHERRSLIEAFNRKLYGITSLPTGFESTIISYDPDSETNTHETLSSNSLAGSKPRGDLIQATDSLLYGMTSEGGTSGFGVLFSYNPVASTYNKLLNFNGVNGANPMGGLLQASNSKLYGMTSKGGVNDYGIIFSYNPSTSTYIKLKDFDNLSGSFPHGGFLQASDGKLYGLTSAGGISNRGTLFSFDPDSLTFHRLVDFDSVSGAAPKGSLMQASNGLLYGVTSEGGSYNKGVLFSYDIKTSAYEKLQDFNDSTGTNPISSLIEFRECSLNATVLADTIKCYGGTTLITIKAIDGMPPYQYSLNNGLFQNSAVFTAGAGSHTATIKDATGCTKSLPVVIDEGPKLFYYRDEDGDGYGSPLDSILSCSPLPKHANNNRDCNDKDSTTHPGATEICDNNMDDDCDGLVDEGCALLPVIVGQRYYFVLEGNGTTTQMKITIRLNRPSDVPVTVHFNSADNTALAFSDYIAKAGIITFPPNSTKQTITFSVISDRVAEGLEFFTITYSNPTGATLLNRTTRIFILDDDFRIPNFERRLKSGNIIVKSLSQGNAKELTVNVYPNPSSNTFTLNVSSSSVEPITIKITDLSGRLIEVVNDLQFKIKTITGSKLQKGVYFAEVTQGKQSKVVKLFKQ